MGCPEYDELRGELGRLLESSRNERVSSRISHMIDLAEAVEARRRDAQGRLEVCRAERWGERMDAEKATDGTGTSRPGSGPTARTTSTARSSAGGRTVWLDAYRRDRRSPSREGCDTARGCATTSGAASSRSSSTRSSSWAAAARRRSAARSRHIGTGMVPMRRVAAGALLAALMFLFGAWLAVG